jgi:hypothetical protein
MLWSRHDSQGTRSKEFANCLDQLEDQPHSDPVIRESIVVRHLLLHEGDAKEDRWHGRALKTKRGSSRS